MSDKVRPSATVVKSINTYVDNVLTDFDSAPTLVLDRNESASGVTVTVTNEATGQYKASWTNGAWTAGDRLRLKVSVGALNSVSQVGVIVWEGEIDELIDSRLAPTTAGRTIDIDANGYVERVVLCDTLTTNSDKTGYALSASGVTAVQSGLATAAAISALNDVSTADIDASLAAYDAPTKSEMDAAFTEIKGATWSSLTDTLEAIRDRGDSAWITATGFSTLDAAGIRTAVGLAAANLDTQLGAITADTNELQVDWTDGGRLDLILDSILEDTGTTLSATLSIIAGYIDTEITAIKAKTDNLPTDPATETTLAALDNLIDAIKAVTDKLNTGLEDDGSSGYQFTTLALENGPSGSGLDAAGVRAAVGLATANLDTQLSGIVSDIAAIDTGAGTGANTFTIHVQDGDGADLENASVRMILGAENYLATTDANGDVSVSRDDGTWSVAITLPGYSFTATTLAVSASLEGSTQTYVMTAETAPESDPGFVTGQAICYDADGNVESGVTVSLQLTKLPSGSTGLVLDSSERSTTSNGSGYAYFTGLLPGAQYQVGRDDTDQQFLVTIPSGATSPTSLPSFFGVDS